MKNLSDIALLFNNIENSKGSNAKKEILELGLKSEFREDLEKVLFHIYNPLISTGISKKSWNNAPTGILRNFNTFTELLDYIHENNTGKQETVRTLKSFSKKFNDIESLLIYRISTKDINIGISTTTVRKYIEIPKFEIMLGEQLNDDVDFNREFILTKKLDGVNLTCFKEGNSITFFTRQGQQVFGLQNITEEYKKMPDGVYFGEALYSDESQAKDRKELYRLSTGELNSKKEFKKISHWLFDYVTLEEWNSEKFICPYSATIVKLKTLENINDFKYIKTVPYIYKGTGKEEAFKLLDDAKSKGWEGLVLRYSSSVYEKKRSSNFIKLKPFSEYDLRIIDYKEFKHPGKLGAFICEDDTHTVIASVGGGYTDIQREEFWKNKENLIGKIIEVKSMEITENKNGQKSLRFPTFLRFRDDKNETNIM